MVMGWLCVPRVQTWDNVIGHTPETVKRTGLFLVGATAVISLAAAVTEIE